MRESRMAVVTYRRSSRATGSLGTSVSNGTLKGDKMVLFYCKLQHFQVVMRYECVS